MKYRKWLVPLCAALTLLLLAGGGILYMSVHTMGISVGRYLRAGGNPVLILHNSPIRMSARAGADGLFDSFSDGDKILVLHDGIAESYPGQTGVYAVIKLQEGTIGDVSYDVRADLNRLGWKTEVNLTLPESIPEDFSFALTWGVYGISSYDSRTGKLIKTGDASRPQDYITEYILPAEYRESIYNYIRAMDLNTYPAEYNPHDGLASCPPMTLILTVRAGGAERTVKAKDIACSYESDNKKGQTFLTACHVISQILTSSDEWKSLPDYEFLYD